MPILRGDVEISSSLRLTVSLFGGKSNGQWLVVLNFIGRYWVGGAVIVCYVVYGIQLGWGVVVG